MAEAEAVYRYESGYISHSAKKDYGPLDFTGKLAGGLRLDIRRRAPLFCSDWTDAFMPENFQKSVSSILYLFIAALAPAITFGSRFLDGTNGQFGVLEMIMSTSISGLIFSTFAGQPCRSLVGSPKLRLANPLCVSGIRKLTNLHTPACACSQEVLAGLLGIFRLSRPINGKSELCAQWLRLPQQCVRS
ncbi:SLC4A1 [Symbiodinium microadriaticum]|nr:SLC4A1 [Symbiodinium microadriaticum]